MDEIYFSQIREDSRVELYLQNVFQPKRVVCIGSGGCTAISLLNKSVETVYAVDINRAQCALIELKKAAIQEMDLNMYLRFIGENPSTDRIEKYFLLRSSLPQYVRDFWDRHKLKIAKGINRSGVTERFYQFVGKNLRENVCGKQAARELFNCTSIEEQRVVYKKYFMTESWKTALNILLSKTSHLEFYPQFWFSNVEENEFVSFFTEQFEKEILFKGISDNYFLSQLLLGSYLYHQSEGVPRYLTAEGFESAKQNINKLVVVNNSLQAFLSDEDNVDAFFMSNVFDWGKSIDRQSICKAVLSAKAKQSLVLYRNMYAETELPEEFSSKFEADDALSQELLAMERSMLYRRVTAGMLS